MCVRLLGAVFWHANVLAKLDAIQGHVQANEGRANGDFPPGALKSEIDKHPQYMAERSGAKHKLSLWKYWWWRQSATNLSPRLNSQFGGKILGNIPPRQLPGSIPSDIPSQSEQLTPQFP